MDPIVHCGDIISCEVSEVPGVYPRAYQCKMMSLKQELCLILCFINKCHHLLFVYYLLYLAKNYAHNEQFGFSFPDPASQD